jgi:hypothetical protein
MVRAACLFVAVALAGSEIDPVCFSPVGGCPTDDSTMALCLGSRLKDVLRAHGHVAELLESLGGAPPAGATFDPLPASTRSPSRSRRPPSPSGAPSHRPTT